MTMKFKDYLYKNPAKGMIVDMRILQFLAPNVFEFGFEHYQNLRIIDEGADDNLNEGDYNCVDR